MLFCYKQIADRIMAYTDLTFSVELLQLAKYELDFLSAVDQCASLSDPAVIDVAIRRYEQLWLPLIAAAKNFNSLAPPLDVHWIWHCHMLSPYNYQVDCQQIVGKVVDHAVRSTEDLIAARKKTARIWKEKYATEPFDLVLTLPSSEPAIQPLYTRVSRYDLAAAVGRQAKFFYNVSLPHYKDDRFLSFAAERYKKFLYVKQQHQDALLIPCYDIDLLWHTHQLHPAVYEKDTIRILGRMLNHDDSLDDRSPGSRQQVAYGQTKRLWKEVFKECYPMDGAMYRGISPVGRLAPYPQPSAIDSLNSNMEQLQVSANPNSTQTVLDLHPAAFKELSIPENMEELWGPIEMPRLTDGTRDKCQVASHR
jgi:hypothetical protein